MKSTYYTFLYGKLLTLIEEGPVNGCDNLLDLYSDDDASGVRSHYRIPKSSLHNTASAAIRAEADLVNEDLVRAERNLISVTNQVANIKKRLAMLETDFAQAKGITIQ